MPCTQCCHSQAQQLTIQVVIIVAVALVSGISWLPSGAAFHVKSGASHHFKYIIMLTLISLYHVGNNPFVCMDCNTKVEKERPWLLEHGFVSPQANCSRKIDQHSWAHPLVLTMPPHKPPVPPVELHLKNLKAQLDAINGKLNNWIGWLEPPLHKLLALPVDKRLGKLEGKLDIIKWELRNWIWRRRLELCAVSFVAIMVLSVIIYCC